jgi:hypothetical protein
MDKTPSMKLLSRLVVISAALFFIGAGVAKADTSQILYFDLTGPFLNATFALSSNPVPFASDNSCGFGVTPIDLIINGVDSNDFLGFYNGKCGGAFAAFPNAEVDPDLSVFGAKLYRGHASNPFFLPTSPSGINLTDGNDDGLLYNLTISTTPTPEPSSLMLLGMVLLPLGIAAKRLL